MEHAILSLRAYTMQDCPAMARLFYDTVHAINIADYTPQQVQQWAAGWVDLAAWDRRFALQDTLLAMQNGQLVGFASMESTGYLDMLYVHKDHQRCGIASALCDRLERGFSTIITHASITAKPFFLHRGYAVVKEQQVVKNGVAMTNFVMIKQHNTGR